MSARRYRQQLVTLMRCRCDTVQEFLELSHRIGEFDRSRGCGRCMEQSQGRIVNDTQFETVTRLIKRPTQFMKPITSGLSGRSLQRPRPPPAWWRPRGLALTGVGYKCPPPWRQFPTSSETNSALSWTRPPSTLAPSATSCQGSTHIHTHNQCTHNIHPEQLTSRCL
jgi:hypothetical protein